MGVYAIIEKKCRTNLDSHKHCVDDDHHSVEGSNNNNVGGGFIYIHARCIL